MANYQQAAKQFALKYGLKPGIFLRQIRQESGFNPNAVSPAGAQGIAQFMPATARGMGVNPRDPISSLDGAARLMAQYVKRFGNYRDALVAYNAGPGTVGKALPAETQAYVRNILGGSNPASRAGGQASTTTTTSTTSITPQAQHDRRAALAQFVLAGANADPLKLAENVAGLNRQTQTTVKVKTSGGIMASTGAAGSFRQVFEKAAAINNQHLPYQWGGGHGPTPAKPGVPVDCSGAVSEVLGVSPRVAAQFKTYGQAGRGRNVTIWAAKDGHHVLMEINGHFWGTSATNPGGGAGWIPRAAISSQYLSGFVARHPPGM